MAATEVSFAKSFLSLLDSKQTKIAPDHVEDARGYPPTVPYTLPKSRNQPSLAKRLKPSSSKNANTTGSSSPSSEPKVSVAIKSLRNPPLEIKTEPLPVSTTSALDLKQRVAREADVALEKVKLLYNKKPVGDTKSLKEILGLGTNENGAKDGAGAGAVVEFSVMIMGGQAALGTGGYAKAKAEAEAKAKEAEARAQAEPQSQKDRGGAETGAGTGTGTGTVAQGLSGLDVLGTEQFWADLSGFLQQRVRDEGVASELVSVFRGAWREKS